MTTRGLMRGATVWAQVPRYVSGQGYVEDWVLGVFRGAQGKCVRVRIGDECPLLHHSRVVPAERRPGRDYEIYYLLPPGPSGTVQP